METAYFTICARNYLAYARALGESLRKYVPGARFTVVLADDASGTEGYPEQILPMAALPLPQLRAMQARYNLLELATAIKPACFRHFLGEPGVHRAVYLDPDLYILAPLTDVDDALDAGASCVLTPHLLAPLTDTAKPSDLDILSSGSFNLGFAAFDNSAESLAFLEWWQTRLVDQGYNDPPGGLFVDQKWMEFAPSFLPRLKILHHPGYNVAYWNLASRPITRAGDGRWKTGEAPLVFFHFSGVVPGDPSVFSKHQNRFTVESLGEAAVLLRDYLTRLDQHGHADWSRLPYAHGAFSDGTPISDVVRRALGRGQPPEGWFERLDTSFWDAPSPDVDAEPGYTITRLMVAIHASRPDLQTAFPLGSRAGRRGFHAWFVAHGMRELQLGDAQVKAALTGSAAAVPGLANVLARLRLAFAPPARR